MSVSVSIFGIREPDGKLSDMIDLKEQCDKVKAQYPQELKDYFGHLDELTDADYCTRDYIIKKSTEIHLKYGLEIPGLIDGSPEYSDGAVIDLSLLPDDIKKLRVALS